jgi:hypothetical protein
MPREYGLRPDGTPKSTGFLGTQLVKGGGHATEYSIPLFEKGDPGTPGYEKGPEIPTLVPTLTREERVMMLNDVIPSGTRIPKPILDKSILHARQRMATGQSPFFNPRTEPRIQRRVRRSFDFK